MLALSTLMLVEAAAELALWEQAHSNKEMVAVPHTL
jgi:hypothetical protein